VAAVQCVNILRRQIYVGNEHIREFSAAKSNQICPSGDNT
jgi:hypothetical protein